jgi:recombinational DNA repair protein (RecF pathway)
MRHKYETHGIVLARAHAGEATTFVTLLTPDLGLVHARAQSLRAPGAKLASSLATLSESEVVLVRGKDGWRLTGAVLAENWFQRLPSLESRTTVARVSGLLLRLIAGEAQDVEIFPVMKGFIEALVTLPEDMHEAAEILVVLRALAALGLDTGLIPGEAGDFTEPLLIEVQKSRTSYIARINTGISTSGL